MGTREWGTLSGPYRSLVGVIMSSHEIKATDALRFIAGIADTEKLKISGVLIATAMLLEKAITSPGGTSPGTRKCELCTSTWNPYDTKNNQPFHHSGCSVATLEQEIFKLMTKNN